MFFAMWFNQFIILFRRSLIKSLFTPPVSKVLTTYINYINCMCVCGWAFGLGGSRFLNVLLGFVQPSKKSCTPTYREQKPKEQKEKQNQLLSYLGRNIFIGCSGDELANRSGDWLSFHLLMGRSCFCFVI